MYLFEKLDKYTIIITDPKLVYPNKREDIITYKDKLYFSLRENDIEVR